MQTPEEKLHFIEGKLDKILIYMFGDNTLDKDAQGFAMQIKNEIRSSKNELLGELEEVRHGIRENRQEMVRLKDKMLELEKKQIKYNVQTAIMWAALGGTAALIGAYAVHQLKAETHAVIFSTIKIFHSLLNIFLWITT